MIRNQQLILSAILALSAALPAFAQSPAARPPRVQPPYTVEFKTSRVQTLANGTTITTETKEVMARDQNLRRMTSTTNMSTADRPAITTVRVNDPNTGDEISWTSMSKVARDVRRPVGDQRHGCWATPDGRFRANYGVPNGGNSLRPPSLPAGATAPLAPDTGGPRPGETVTGPDGQDVTMVGVKPGAQAPGSGTTGSTLSSTAAPGGPITDLKPRVDQNNMVREDLGADTIMGVEVRGSRTTVTIPAGAQGNDQPLVSTNEIWMAPSLGMVLRSVSDDPRMGKSNREVVSLDLNNPDPALFQLPADYTVNTEVMQPVACQ